MTADTVNELEQWALLPAGLRDMLPPNAAFEARVCETLVATFAGYGYDRIKPPLVEFEDGLVSGAGAAVQPDTFRLMDPVSQRMMGVRADMTPQVARIALTRFADMPRPLRLSYSGEVLRVRGTQLRPERQFRQVGAELIGTENANADVEIMQMAAESLQTIGVPRLSLDLTIPPLVPALLQAHPLPVKAQAALRDALDRKDADAVQAHGGDAADTLCKLMDATGPSQSSLETLRNLQLPDAAARELDRMRDVLHALGNRLPDLETTIDPVENRGFEYHTGIAFTFFSGGERGEIGGGGRYEAFLGDDRSRRSEFATGFTLYIDNILRVLNAPEEPSRILVPANADNGVADALRRDGWITVGDLEPVADILAEARRMGCSHVWDRGRICELETRSEP